MGEPMALPTQHCQMLTYTACTGCMVQHAGKTFRCCAGLHNTWILSLVSNKLIHTLCYPNIHSTNIQLWPTEQADRAAQLR